MIAAAGIELQEPVRPAEDRKTEPERPVRAAENRPGQRQANEHEECRISQAGGNARLRRHRRQAAGKQRHHDQERADGEAEAVHRETSLAGRGERLPAINAASTPPASANRPPSRLWPATTGCGELGAMNWLGVTWVVPPSTQRISV